MFSCNLPPALFQVVWLIFFHGMKALNSQRCWFSHSIKVLNAHRCWCSHSIKALNSQKCWFSHNLKALSVLWYAKCTTRCTQPCCTEKLETPTLAWQSGQLFLQTVRGVLNPLSYAWCRTRWYHAVKGETPTHPFLQTVCGVLNPLSYAWCRTWRCHGVKVDPPALPFSCRL